MHRKQGRFASLGLAELYGTPHHLLALAADWQEQDYLLLRTSQVMATNQGGAVSALLTRVIFGLRVRLLAHLSAFVSYLKGHHSAFCQSPCGCLLLPLLQTWILNLSLSHNLSRVVDHWHRRRSPRRLPSRIPYLSRTLTPTRVLFRDPLLLLYLDLSPSGYPRPPLSVFRLVFQAVHRLQITLLRFNPMERQGQHEWET